jgi:phosphocarrier protein
VQQINLAIDNKVGLHARPAALFVEMSNRYQCRIRVSNAKGEDANGKSILGILSLDIGPGEEISILAEGDDAEEAVASILALFHSNFEDSGASGTTGL